MTHNEPRQDWLHEGLIGLGTGVLYGMTSIAVGHPFDTVKTKMQAQHGYLEGGGMMSSFRHVWRDEGLRGLYRGAIPPLWGSGLYRSTQFAVYEALYTKWGQQEWGQTVIPYTGGIQCRVAAAGLIASLSRAVIECPIEYAKVNRQTGQSWKVAQLYTGFSYQAIRTSGVMVTYFLCIDSFRRHTPNIFQSTWGQFLASAGSATLGFWLVWPFEVLKNQVQAHTTIEKGGKETSSVSMIDRVKYLTKQHGGIAGLYRGLWPGTCRSFISNGCSMVVMSWAQRKVTELGWR